jgi:nitrite reductase/ring-hydroxylating ferredoxin subunit
VYRNQIGVDRRYANAGTFRERNLESFSRPACNQTELGEGQLMLLRVGNERIALGRTPDGFFAFSDHCTHRGGPLCDGALAGNTVQCPWHGSQFDVRTSRVVAGPATEQIKTYAIDIRNGEVYVRDPNAPAERKVA